MTWAVIIGESHTSCMMQAVLDDPQRMDGIAVYRFAGKRSTPGDGSISIKEAATLVSTLPPEVPVFLSIMGGFHNIMGLVRQQPDFDVLTGRDDTIADLDVLNIIPYRILLDAFDFHIESSAKYLPIRRVARGPVFLICTPPPKAQSAFILEKFEKEYRGRNVIEIGLNSPRIRQKFWEIECVSSKKWTEKFDVSYLMPPEECFDDQLFLKEIYYEDVTHANRHYGALVLEQVLGIVGKQREGVAHG
jgi:hypothetical protein